MSNLFPVSITEHPLFKAVEHCIIDSDDYYYDYRKFYSSWDILGNLSYHQMIKQLFDVSDDDVEEYVARDRPNESAILLYSSLRLFDTEICKDVALFVFSLPILEYSLHNNLRHNIPCSWSENTFSKNLREFVYEDELIEIEDSEIFDYFKFKVNNSKNTDIIDGLKRVAFTNLANIFRCNLLEPSYKQTFFTCVIEPLCSFITMTSGVSILPTVSVRSSNYGRKNSIVMLDIYIGIENENDQLESVMEICCTIEVKPFPMIEIYEGPPIKGSGFFKLDKIPNFMRQKIVQLTYFLTNYGSLTDAYTTIVLIIDLDKFEEKKEELYKRKSERIIPLKYKIVNNRSHCPSTRMTLFYHLSKSIVPLKELKERQKRMVEFRKYLEKDPNDILRRTSRPRKRRRQGPPPSSNTSESSFSEGTSTRTSPPSSRGVQSFETLNEVDEPVEALICEGLDSIQRGICNSQIFKIDAKKLKSFLPVEVIENNKVVLKVYDPSMCREANILYQSREERHAAQDDYIRTFKVERLFLQELYDDKNFNSCYIPHKTGLISIIIDGLAVAEGYFNLLRYIECQPLQSNIETYKKAKRQLEIIHKHGIIHGDIAKRNILYSKDEKIYIIDFQNALRDNKDGDSLSKKVDMDNLDKIFHADRIL